MKKKRNSVQLFDDILSGFNSSHENVLKCVSDETRPGTSRRKADRRNVRPKISKPKAKPAKKRNQKRRKQKEDDDSLPEEVRAKMAEINDIANNYELHITRDGGDNEENKENSNLAKPPLANKSVIARPNHSQIGTSTPSLFGDKNRRARYDDDDDLSQVGALGVSCFLESSSMLQRQGLSDSSTANVVAAAAKKSPFKRPLQNEAASSRAKKPPPTTNYCNAGDRRASSLTVSRDASRVEIAREWPASFVARRRTSASTNRVGDVAENSVILRSGRVIIFDSRSAHFDKSIDDLFLSPAPNGSLIRNVANNENRLPSKSVIDSRDAPSARWRRKTGVNVVPAAATALHSSPVVAPLTTSRLENSASLSRATFNADDVKIVDLCSPVLPPPPSDNKIAYTSFEEAISPEVLPYSDRVEKPAEVDDLIAELLEENATCNDGSSLGPDQSASVLSTAALSTCSRTTNRLMSRISFSNAFSPYATAQSSMLDRMCYDQKQMVFLKCGQPNGPIAWSDALPLNLLKKCTKIGEGTYGEVFLTENSNGDAVALKIVPIEGNFNVNDEAQKTYEEILPEILIATEMSSLRNNVDCRAPNFLELKNVSCVKGSYPERLLNAWDAFNEKTGSENDRPDFFDEHQLFIILEFENGGVDLEKFEFKSALEAKSTILQLTLALAVAEQALQFEHRDLHIGNVLIKPTKQRTLSYAFDGKEIRLKSHGVEAFIIDFTNSRLSKDGITIFTDLANDDALFQGQGDYQFEVYRLMKHVNENEWKHFEPKTNLLWLHYLVDKVLNVKKFNKRKMIARQARTLEDFNGHLLLSSSCVDIFNGDKISMVEELILRG